MEEDSCSLYNPAKSLMQQFSASNRLALSHPESLSLSELPGADHQNRLCFHFPFQITGDTYDSGKSFAPHPPSDAIPCPDADCLVLSWTPGELLVALGSRLPWCHSHAGPGEGAEKDNARHRGKELLSLLVREPEVAHTEPDLLFIDIPIADSCQKDTMLLLRHWSDLLGGGWAPLSTASPIPHITSARGFISSYLFLSFEAVPSGYLSLCGSSQQDAAHWLCLWVRRSPASKLASSSCCCPASPPCWARCCHQSLCTQS